MTGSCWQQNSAHWWMFKTFHQLLREFGQLRVKAGVKNCWHPAMSVARPQLSLLNCLVYFLQSPPILNHGTQSLWIYYQSPSESGNHITLSWLPFRYRSLITHMFSYHSFKLRTFKMYSTSYLTFKFICHHLIIQPIVNNWRKCNQLLAAMLFTSRTIQQNCCLLQNLPVTSFLIGIPPF